jgi:hypothetical protein
MSKEHGRERVPPGETEEMINSAIAGAATTFGVPAGSIKKRNIRIANRPNAHKIRPNCSAQLAEKV